MPLQEKTVERALNEVFESVDPIPYQLYTIQPLHISFVLVVVAVDKGRLIGKRQANPGLSTQTQEEEQYAD